MEIYETEEQQVAALKRWWKANGSSAITGVVIGIAMILGWNFWQNSQLENARNASSLYQQLLSAIDSKNSESADKISQRLVEQYDATVYAEYAALFQAKIKVGAGEFEQAKTILQQLMATSEKEMQHVARIRLVRLMLATQQYEQGLQLISEVDATSSESFEGSYQELTGDLYSSLGRLGEARTAYQSALRLGQRTPLLQFKIDDITAPEIIETVQ